MEATTATGTFGQWARLPEFRRAAVAAACAADPMISADRLDAVYDEALIAAASELEMCHRRDAALAVVGVHMRCLAGGRAAVVRWDVMRAAADPVLRARVERGLGRMVAHATTEQLEHAYDRVVSNAAGLDGTGPAFRGPIEELTPWLVVGVRRRLVTRFQEDANRQAIIRGSAALKTPVAPSAADQAIRREETRIGLEEFAALPRETQEYGLFDGKAGGFMAASGQDRVALRTHQRRLAKGVARFVERAAAALLPLPFFTRAHAFLRRLLLGGNAAETSAVFPVKAAALIAVTCMAGGAGAICFGTNAIGLRPGPTVAQSPHVVGRHAAPEHLTGALVPSIARERRSGPSQGSRHSPAPAPVRRSTTSAALRSASAPTASPPPSFAISPPATPAAPAPSGSINDWQR